MRQELGGSHLCLKCQCWQNKSSTKRDQATGGLQNGNRKVSFLIRGEVKQQASLPRVYLELVPAGLTIEHMHFEKDTVSVAFLLKTKVFFQGSKIS